MKAQGTFEVKTAPQTGVDAAVARLSLDKQFEGDLEGSGKGEMLAFRSGASGSAGYVAMELVSGRLAGRSGSFALQHSGTMTNAARTLSITIVPDSGTGELIGLSGQISIDMIEGKHFYTLIYELPEV